MPLSIQALRVARTQKNDPGSGSGGRWLKAGLKSLRQQRFHVPYHRKGKGCVSLGIKKLPQGKDNFLSELSLSRQIILVELAARLDDCRILALKHDSHVPSGVKDHFLITYMLHLVFRPKDPCIVHGDRQNIFFKGKA
jgi:hypothetical protein